MFGFGRKKETVGPFTKFVMDNYGEDSFFIQNRENEAEEANVLYIALTLGLKKATCLKTDKDTKKRFKNTALDLIVCEYTLFTIQQARWILMQEHINTDDDIDDEDLSCFLISAMHIFRTLGNKFYGGFDDWCADRLKTYSSNPKEATECFAFNTSSLPDKQNFVGLDRACPDDPMNQLVMIPHAIAYRQAMVPAFIESAQTLLETDLLNEKQF